MSRRGHFKEAAEAYGHILEDHPEHLKALFNSGGVYAEQNLHPQATRCFTKLLETRRGGQLVDSYTLFNRALSKQKSGNMEAALKDYTAAIKLNPSAPEFYLNRSLCARALGNYSLAASDLKTHQSKADTKQMVSDVLAKSHNSVVTDDSRITLPSSIVKKALAWLERSRHRIHRKLLGILAKELYLRDDEDAEYLYKRFAWLTAIQRLAAVSHDEHEDHRHSCKAKELSKRIMLKLYFKGERLAESGKVIRVRVKVRVRR